MSARHPAYAVLALMREAALAGGAGFDRVWSPRRALVLVDLASEYEFETRRRRAEHGRTHPQCPGLDLCHEARRLADREAWLAELAAAP